MAVSLTHAVPFLGYPVAEAFQAFYIDGEMAAYDLRERLRLLSDGLDRMWVPLRIVIPDLSARGIPKIDSDEGRIALLAQLDAHPDIKLVILDNLACLTRPDGDDSHGARSFTFVQDLMLECRRRHVACWIIHHSGKSGEQRGTSKRNDVLDVVIKLTPALSTEGRTEVAVTFEKARHMSPAGKRDFTAVLEPASSKGLIWTRGDSQLPINERARLMLLDGMPPGEVAGELKCNRSFVYRVQKDLIASGEVSKPKKRLQETKQGSVSLSPSLSRETGDKSRRQMGDRGDRRLSTNLSPRVRKPNLGRGGCASSDLLTEALEDGLTRRVRACSGVDDRAGTVSRQDQGAQVQPQPLHGCIAMQCGTVFEPPGVGVVTLSVDRWRPDLSNGYLNVLTDERVDRGMKALEVRLLGGARGKRSAQGQEHRDAHIRPIVQLVSDSVQPLDFLVHTQNRVPDLCGSTGEIA